MYRSLQYFLLYKADKLKKVVPIESFISVDHYQGCKPVVYFKHANEYQNYELEKLTIEEFFQGMDETFRLKGEISYRVDIS